ncbi:MAG TPA: TonB-dependent receptor [Ferruginibacter sp.]|nr:TonB-dependent receptor [Ferruginibacter sp.]HMP21628.1 TonB-dependent receptor [Ferruginibacter sp.]
MMKYYRIALLAMVLISNLPATAQQVTGTLADTSDKKDISNAVVALLKPVDSILYKFTRTAKNGQFSISNVQPGAYILMVTHPYYADYLDEIQITEQGYHIKQLALIPKSKLLQEVIVKTGAPFRMKGDTMIYTADSFKVGPNANVEELLKKLPGIQVDKNGQIKAMGEKVEKVLVDGEEFFGDDPGMAVKNLRADAVKEVQVFDKKSEQSEFTGIDDGKTQKTINLKLKEDRKKGYFGKIEVAGGLMDKINNRFNNNFMLNAFKGKRKISGYLLQGNTGQNGLNWQEQQKFGGSDDNINMDEDAGFFFVTSGGSSDDEPFIDTRNGFFKNLNAGIQYNNKWNDKHTLNFSPKYNEQNYTNTKSTFTQTQLSPETIFNENSTEYTVADKRNIKNNLTYEAKIDSFNTLKLVTKLNIYHSDNSVDLQSENRDINNELNNTRTSNTTNTTDKTAFSNSIIYKHKFKKDRRTFSLNSDFNLQNNTGTTFLYSLNTLDKVNRQDTIDQKKTTENSKTKWLAKAAYTEPLNAKYALELNYEISWLGGNNNLSTLGKTTSNGKYDEIIDTLSNDFRQDITTNKAGFKISYKHKKLKFGFGSAAGFTQFNLKDITLDTNYKRSFTNLFPAANINYSYKQNHSLNFNYNGNTIQPTLNQLQQLRNNNNPLQQYIGNPNLTQSFRHNLRLNHNTYNFLQEMWSYQSVSFNITEDAINNSTTINPVTGEVVTQPVNTGSNISVNTWMGAGKKIKKIDINLFVNYQLNYSRFTDIINGEDNNNSTLGHTIGFNIGKWKEKKYEIGIDNTFGFNSNKSSIYNQKIKYNTYTLDFNGSLFIKKVWKINSSFVYNYRQKTDVFGEDVNNSLWNATVERTFHHDEFTVFASINDILNQNIGIDRSFYGNTLKEVRNNRLQQFWLIGFRWDFKNKGAAPEKK